MKNGEWKAGTSAKALVNLRSGIESGEHQALLELLRTKAAGHVGG